MNKEINCKLNSRDNTREVPGHIITTVINCLMRPSLFRGLQCPFGEIVLIRNGKILIEIFTLARCLNKL